MHSDFLQNPSDFCPEVAALHTAFEETHKHPLPKLHRIWPLVAYPLAMSTFVDGSIFKISVKHSLPLISGMMRSSTHQIDTLLLSLEDFQTSLPVGGREYRVSESRENPFAELSDRIFIVDEKHGLTTSHKCLPELGGFVSLFDVDRLPARRS